MIMKTNQFVRLVLAVAVMASAGCVTLYEKHEEIAKGEERMKVDFESEHAAQLFNSCVAKKLTNKPEKNTSRLAVPFVTFYSKTTVHSENARYNEEVLKCDSNGDGSITEAEARTYWLGT